MRKTADISKYDVDWQIFRVSLKKNKDVSEKLKRVVGYFEDHLNRADRERVLNYLEGLSLAYKDERREEILQLKEELDSWRVSGENRLSRDLSSYKKEDIRSLAKDLKRRSKKWLKKGYVHREQTDFLYFLWSHLGEENELRELREAETESSRKENTHSFFF